MLLQGLFLANVLVTEDYILPRILAVASLVGPPPEAHLRCEGSAGGSYMPFPPRPPCPLMPRPPPSFFACVFLCEPPSSLPHTLVHAPALVP